MVYVAMMALALGATAQQPPAWRDDLMDQLIGNWKVAGTVMGRAAHHRITAQWTLGHQFIEIHEQTSPDAPASESMYDAIWFLGYDTTSKHYVLHLMDIFGGRFSETLGDGTREGNDLLFVFNYPDGPFHTRWSWRPDSKNWEWFMQQRDVSGKWKPFASLTMTRSNPAHKKAAVEQR